MTTTTRVSRFHRVCLSAFVGLVVLGFGYDLGFRGLRVRVEAAPAADREAVAALTPDEMIELLLPNLTEERMRSELAEQMDSLPQTTKAALPADFKTKFIDKFIQEGLPELKVGVAKQVKETYTEAELRVLLDFHRKYPKIIEKQEKLAKSVMKQSMEIGGRIGRSLAK